MRKKYPYLKDNSFLLNLAQEQNSEQFVKITVLNFNEKPIKEIQGKVLSGNMNLDGNSAIRRTGNLTTYIEDYVASYMEIGGLFSLNKKVKIEIGLTNNTDKYNEYPILWFPMGVFVIMSLSISRGTGGTNISLQLKDKMVFLNGECGGTIPAQTIFSEYETLNPETGEYIIQQPTLYQIIQELVNHFGGEQLGKIIISDLDTRIKKVMKWAENNPLYYYLSINGGEGIFLLDALYPSDSDLIKSYEEELKELKEKELENPNDEELKKEIQEVFNDFISEYNRINGEGAWAYGDFFLYKKYYTGEDVGYIYSDFYYPGELIGDAGSSVCDILDKIKNLLGNFEYFYDLDGNFRFQEIKNYLNTTKSTVDINNINQSDYLVNKKQGDAVYNFNNSKIISSFANNPQYSMIKNDFIVWGIKEIGGLKLPIRYHLAIDRKPKVGNTYQVYSYNKEEQEYYKVATEYSTVADFPQIGEIERIYSATEGVYYWDPDKMSDPEYGIPSFEYRYKDEETNIFKTVLKTYYHKIEEPLKTITTTDWRTELFLSGSMTTRFGNDSNYYYPELVNEWQKSYEIIGGQDKIKDEVKENPHELDYYLDFIDSDAAISEFSVENIGRRTKIINDDSVNCLFEKEFPDVILIEAGKENTADLRQECITKGQKYIQVQTALYESLASGGSQNSAYNMIRDLLYQYTSYNETVSVQMLPMYFLEPNNRIGLYDKESGVHGEYMINSISLPLDINGTMSLSCVKALERI